MKGNILLMLSLVCVLIAAGCGGGSSTPPQNTISVSITPFSSTALVSTSVKFAATVAGATDTGVLFSVVEGATGGQVLQTGEYVAPRAAGTFHVRATSRADATKWAEATVTVRDYQQQIQRMADLTDGRDDGGATLLPDGSILLTGGRSMSGPVQQAEQYIPSENRYVPAGTMLSIRLAHTSTLLPNGKVLLAGGWDGTSFDPYKPAWQTSEIYNPAYKTFTAGPQMTVPRWRHVATPLKDGRILLTGGLQLLGTGFGASPNNEIYDPASNTFTAVGRMVESGRFRHTATLLADGRVLLVGGRNNSCVTNCPIFSLASAEIFDPTTGSFTATSSLNISRYWHTATLLEDGRVLILGGESTEDLGTGSDQVQQAEIYDPATGQFSLSGQTVIPRGQHTATVLNNGRIFLAGGAIRSGVATLITEIFDPVSAKSVQGPDLIEQHVRHAAIRLPNGEVVIIGGSNLYQPVPTTELFR